MKEGIKNIWGYFLLALAKIINWLFTGIIKVMSFFVEKTKIIRRAILSILGFFLFLIFLSPLGFLLLTRMSFFLPLLFFFLFPIIGGAVVSFFTLWRYALGGYLNDRSQYYRAGIGPKKTLKSYKEEFFRFKEEAEEAAREKRRREQEAYWSNVFEDFFKGFQGGNYTNFDGFPGGSYGQYQGRSSGGFNPLRDFTKKYQESCAALELPLDTDENQVKSAYRRLAKQYHPDVNKAANAKEKFQKINDAYEFLSAENIARYKQLNKM